MEPPEVMNGVPYPKIENVYRRDPVTHKLIPSQWGTPEFAYLDRVDWIAHEKLDGMNIRLVLRSDGTVDIFGRTDRANIPTGLGLVRARVAEVWASEDRSTEWPIILYGEGIGPGIQKGAGYCQEQQVVVFDARIGKTWLPLEQVEGIAGGLGLRTAPCLNRAASLGVLTAVAADGFMSQLPGATTQAEGLIARPAVPLLDQWGTRIITKIKTKDFS